MATFIAATASNSPKLRDAVAAQRVLDRYHFDGDIEASVHADEPSGDRRLFFYGYDWPGAWRIPEGVKRDEFEPDYDVGSYAGFELFLKEMAPHLAEPFTIQAIGFERCRFPLSACEWHIGPDSTVIEINDFKHGDLEPVVAPDEPTVTLA